MHLSSSLCLGFLWGVSLFPCWLPCISAVTRTCPIWSVSFVSSSVSLDKDRPPEVTRLRKQTWKETLTIQNERSHKFSPLPGMFKYDRELCDSSVNWFSSFLCQKSFSTHFSWLCPAVFAGEIKSYQMRPNSTFKCVLLTLLSTWWINSTVILFQSFSSYPKLTSCESSYFYCPFFFVN